MLMTKMKEGQKGTEQLVILQQLLKYFEPFTDERSTGKV